MVSPSSLSSWFTYLWTYMCNVTVFSNGSNDRYYAHCRNANHVFIKHIAVQRLLAPCFTLIFQFAYVFMNLSNNRFVDIAVTVTYLFLILLFYVSLQYGMLIHTHTMYKLKFTCFEYIRVVFFVMVLSNSIECDKNIIFSVDFFSHLWRPHHFDCVCYSRASKCLSIQRHITHKNDFILKRRWNIRYRFLLLFYDECSNWPT